MGLADNQQTLDQFVQMAAESAELEDPESAYATDVVVDLAEEYDQSVMDALEEMVKVKRLRPKSGATAEDLYDAEGPLLILMTLRGEGVGTWDGSWDEFYDDTEEVDKWLKDVLSGYAEETGTGVLNEYFEIAAYQTAAPDIYEAEFWRPRAGERARAVLRTTGATEGEDVVVVRDPDGSDVEVEYLTGRLKGTRRTWKVWDIVPPLDVDEHQSNPSRFYFSSPRMAQGEPLGIFRAGRAEYEVQAAAPDREGLPSYQLVGKRGARYPTIRNVPRGWLGFIHGPQWLTSSVYFEDDRGQSPLRSVGSGTFEPY